MKQSKNEINLGEGSVGRLLLTLAVPSVIAQLVNLLYNLVHLGRMRDKSRKVLTITEVTGMQEGEIVLKDLYRYVEKPSDGEAVCGELQRVGTLFNQEKCKRAGITLPGTGE